NGWPVNTPVNASPHTSRYATHDSGTLWIAGPSMVGDFHPLISTGLPAHTV
ncbi:peptidase, partial [Klebsiella pneumoniae]